MTAYHEEDPNFWGTDRTLDPSDVTPAGGMWRLDNDIFPDDLFAAGTRLDYFFSANNVGESNYVRDPAAGYYEMEILPSSMTSQRAWNCVLYVDHANSGSQALIEAGLRSILGTASQNAETTNWDRYDVNTAGSKQVSFGRPLQTDYGATLVQVFAYRTILWDSGSSNAFNLIKEDADVLLPWLTLNGLGQHNLYLSGDGIVFSAISEGESEPSAKHLVESVAGVGLRTSCASGNYSIANCPTSGAPKDLTPCVNLDPVSGALVANHPARALSHLGEGNGCPELRSFDVLSLLNPGAVGDERYASPVKSAPYASATANPSEPFKIVVDGLSVSNRRDLGTPCDYFVGGKAAITERLNEVLTYFGYASTSNSPCTDPTIGVGIVPQPVPVRIPTLLSELVPNPISAGQTGHIRFSLERDAAAKLEILDLQGRRVRTIFDGPAKVGQNEAIWDGRDASGTYVANGVYFYRFRALDQDQTRKLVIVGGRN
jgi:hypothetical protein